MSGGFALPRIRTRRRKPRGPEWRRSFRWACWCLGMGVLCFLLGSLVSAVAMWVCSVPCLRELHWFPADPDAPVPTVEQLAVNAAFSIGGFALAVLGIFV